jgi:hypothetical protein
MSRAPALTCLQRHMGPARFVFLDETGTATTMARRYGRSLSQQRLVAAVPHGHWRSTTFVAGLRQTGIAAPLVPDGPMTGPAFRAYVEQFLAPSLAPGDVVVLDKLGSAQGRRYPPGARRGRRVPLLLAALQPGSEPDRAALRQAQGAAPQGRGQDPGRVSGPPSAACSTPARPSNAPTISTTAAMGPPNSKML